LTGTDRLVLVVDDDDGIRSVVVPTLEDEGYEAAEATNGAEALALVRERMPALILLDMRMPLMNGWEFAAAYKELPAPRAPIVVVTAGRDAAQKARDIGADGYLGKPFDLDQLTEIVARHVPRTGDPGTARPDTTP
jgi:CheY-like chemotaxis protein